MALQLDSVVHACNGISRQIRDAFKQLTIHYIVHHDGQRVEALSLAGQEILNHPAAESALHILTKAKHSEESAMIGMAVARQHLFFGLASRDTILALCSINIDQYENLREVKQHAYHLAWHAIDALEYQNDPANRSGALSEIIIRKRNALEIASSNLQADVFSAVISALHGERDSIRKIGQTRSIRALHNMSSHTPEHYPYAIAMDATEVAMNRLMKKPPHKRKYAEAALRVSREIGKTFDEMSLKHWLSFSEPAQDMAWRGFSAEDILSAAIHTSEDTYVRATGYLVAEITGIKPSSILDIRQNYSPFADNEFNRKLHEKAINEIFEDVIAHCLSQNSIDPFMEMAHRQNLQLTEGRALGWCAAALQSSGKAFMHAIENGKEPEWAARKEFEGEQSRTTWDSLMILGRKIIGQYRRGEPVTMSSMAELCKGEKGTGSITKSIEMTMKDPSYQKRLEAANELAKRTGPRPKIPAPSIQKHAAPSAAVMPGLGKNAAQAARENAIQQQRQQQQKEAQDSGDRRE